MKDDLVFNQTTKITPYLATAIAEGFCEGEDSTPHDQMRAWAYLVKTGRAWVLQGLFGRRAKEFIDNEFLTKEGKVLWSNLPLPEERG